MEELFDIKYGKYDEVCAEMYHCRAAGIDPAHELSRETLIAAIKEDARQCEGFFCVLRELTEDDRISQQEAAAMMGRLFPIRELFRWEAHRYAKDDEICGFVEFLAKEWSAGRTISDYLADEHRKVFMKPEVYQAISAAYRESEVIGGRLKSFVMQTRLDNPEKVIGQLKIALVHDEKYDTQIGTQMEEYLHLIEQDRRTIQQGEGRQVRLLFQRGIKVDEILNPKLGFYFDDMESAGSAKILGYQCFPSEYGTNRNPGAVHTYLRSSHEAARYSGHDVLGYICDSHLKEKMRNRYGKETLDNVFAFDQEVELALIACSYHRMSLDKVTDKLLNCATAEESRDVAKFLQEAAVEDIQKKYPDMVPAPTQPVSRPRKKNNLHL